MKKRILSLIVLICFAAFYTVIFAAGVNIDDTDGKGIFAEGIISVALVSSKDNIVYGEEVTLTAAVTFEPIPETIGKVTFYEGETAISDALSLDDENAVSFTTALPAGVHSIHAVYAENEALSDVVTITVTKANVDIQLKTSKDIINVGDNVTFTATMDKEADGNIEFFYVINTKEEKSIKIQPIEQGVAEITTDKLPAENLEIKAVFAGNDNYNSSTSNIIKQTVLSDDNYLSNLRLSKGSISFSKNKTEYSISLGNSYEEIKIRPTASHKGAKITVDGRTVESGKESNYIYLREGAKTDIEIIVTAENGDKKIYNINAYREKSRKSKGRSIRYRFGDELTPIVYSDISYHWADNIINTLTEKEIFTGEKHGNISYFYPDRDMTRTEFSVIIARMMKLDVALTRYLDLPFNDESSIPEWGSEEVRAVYFKGWMGGDGQNFNPDSSITRAEAMTVIARIKGLNGTQTHFNDSNDIPAWAQGAISGLVKRGIASGYSDNTIRPNNTITRAEIASLVYKTLNL